MSLKSSTNAWIAYWRLPATDDQFERGIGVGHSDYPTYRVVMVGTPPLRTGDAWGLWPNRVVAGWPVWPEEEGDAWEERTVWLERPKFDCWIGQPSPFSQSREPMLGGGAISGQGIGNNSICTMVGGKMRTGYGPPVVLPPSLFSDEGHRRSGCMTIRSTPRESRESPSKRLSYTAKGRTLSGMGTSATTCPC